MRLCRCGYLGDPVQGCTRVPKCALEYQSKISGPLFDRIDLHVEVGAVSAADLALPPPAEGTADVARRVARARATQKARYAALRGAGGDAGDGGAAGDGGNGGGRGGRGGKHRNLGAPTIRTNAEADGKLLEAVAAPDAEGRHLLMEATDRLRLTARGYHRVLRVARTLADLDGSENVTRLHVAEALSYRRIVPGRNALLMGG